MPALAARCEDEAAFFWHWPFLTLIMHFAYFTSNGVDTMQCNAKRCATPSGSPVKTI